MKEKLNQKSENQAEKKLKKTAKLPYLAPEIKTESIEIAHAMGKVCNGSTAGGRKDAAGAGCATLLT